MNGLDSAKDAASPILTVDNLTVGYRSGGDVVHAVRSVSFALRRREVFGIVGESGSGKTTLMLAIIGMLASSARILGGSVVYEGVDLLKLTQREMRSWRGREISMMPQRPMNALSPVGRVGSQLKRLIRSLSDGGTAVDEVLPDLLTRVGLGALTERLDCYPHELSGGQMQRLLIAIAVLAAKPKVLLADEPTSTLDVTVQAQILNLLRQIRDDIGVSIVIASHDLGVIAQICDRVAVMYGGEVVEMNEVHALFARPAHPYTRDLLAATHERRRSEAAETIDGTREQKPGGRQVARFGGLAPGGGRTGEL